jgi:SM-20-related protein
MPKADFFATLGLFVVKDFFDDEAGHQLRREVSTVARKAATIAGEKLDENVRRAGWAQMSEATVSWVKDRFLAVKPQLEAHFDVGLSDCQRPQFLVYGCGGFYHPHTDNTSETDAARYVRERRVSVVTFLNGQSERPGEGCFGGGALTFYGLLSGPRLKAHGLPLRGEPGLLVAFRSDVFHEVAPVTHGERMTIVSWFF